MQGRDPGAGERRMVMELLFNIVAFLFWPILIIGLIAFWIRRRRTGRFAQFEQVLSEMSDLLQQVLQRMQAVERGAPLLWDYVRTLMDDAVHKGFLLP